jgi:molybdate transport system permease protein
MTLIELPLVLPPAVAGIGLLASLGPDGLLGRVLAGAHIELVLQTAGVVVALVFVSLPLFLRAAQTAFEGLQPTHLEAGLALGGTRAGVFFHIALPAARPGLLAGTALAWARAVGEFGATLMFAGSFQGVTQTAPLAIYEQFATDLPAALALSAVLVIVSGSLLLTVKLLATDRDQPPM